MLVGELPLTLAHAFPEIKRCHALRENAAGAVSEAVLELTNGQGMVRGAYLSHFLPLLASWSRCYATTEQLKKCSLSKEAIEQIGWAATQSLRLTGDDGRWLVSNDDVQQWTPESLVGIIQQAGDRSDVSAAMDILGKKLTKGFKVKPNNRYPETSDNCEWAGVATMRTEWERGEPAVVIDYSSPDLRIAVASSTSQVIRGIWSWDTSIDGQAVEALSSWEETCWFSDEDVDYLELSLDLAGGMQLDRQILLARDEEFLLLADYVLNTNGGEVSHRMQLPLDERCSLALERETREGLLVTDKPVGRVIPLALPEWRTDPRHGELAELDGRLQLAQHRAGKNLACPLLIDLNPARGAQAVHLASAHDCPEPRDSATRRGRRLSCPMRQRPVALLSFACRCSQPLAARPERLLRDPSRPFPRPSRRSRRTTGNRRVTPPRWPIRLGNLE